MPDPTVTKSIESSPDTWKRPPTPRSPNWLQSHRVEAPIAAKKAPRYVPKSSKAAAGILTIDTKPTVGLLLPIRVLQENSRRPSEPFVPQNTLFRAQFEPSANSVHTDGGSAIPAVTDRGTL